MSFSHTVSLGGWRGGAVALSLDPLPNVQEEVDICAFMVSPVSAPLLLGGKLVEGGAQTAGPASLPPPLDP